MEDNINIKKECYKKPFAYDPEKCSKCPYDIECMGCWFKYLDEKE